MTWKGFEIFFCNECDHPASIACPATSCNCGGCPTCGPVFKEFLALSDEEMWRLREQLETPESMLNPMWN